MHDVLARQMPPFGMFDQVDFTNQVGNRDVRRRQLFVIAIIPSNPLDWRIISFLDNEIPGILRQRGERVIVDFAASNNRRPLVEKLRQHPQHLRLALTTQPKKQEVMLRQEPVDNLRHDRFVIPQDAGKQLVPLTKSPQQIPTHLFFNRQWLISGVAKLAKSRGAVGHLEAQSLEWLSHCRGRSVDRRRLIWPDSHSLEPSDFVTRLSKPPGAGTISVSTAGPPSSKHSTPQQCLPPNARIPAYSHARVTQIGRLSSHEWATSMTWEDADRETVSV